MISQSNATKPLFSLLLPSKNRDDEKVININQLQLLALGEVSLLYIHFDSSFTFTEADISKLNKTVFQWEPRTEKHKVSQWLSAEEKTKGLKQHISELLGISLDHDSHYEEDTFGHELVNCTWIKQINGFEDDKSICVSELSAGINCNDPRYKLSKTEKRDWSIHNSIIGQIGAVNLI